MSSDSDDDFPETLANVPASRRSTRSKGLHPPSPLVVSDSDDVPMDISPKRPAPRKKPAAKGKKKDAITVPVARALMASMNSFAFNREAAKLADIRQALKKSEDAGKIVLKALKEEQEKMVKIGPRRDAEIAEHRRQLEMEQERARVLVVELELAEFNQRNKRQPTGFSAYA